MSCQEEEVPKAEGKKSHERQVDIQSIDVKSRV